MDAASHWKVWLDAHTPEASRRITERIAEKLGLELVDFSIEPYPKGGFVAAWTCLHDVPDRNAAIVAVIGHGQKVANGWSLSGSVYDELEGLVSKAGHHHISIAGVTNAHLAHFSDDARHLMGASSPHRSDRAWSLAAAETEARRANTSNLQ